MQIKQKKENDTHTYIYTGCGESFATFLISPISGLK